AIGEESGGRVCVIVSRSMGGRPIMPHAEDKCSGYNIGPMQLSCAYHANITKSWNGAQSREHEQPRAVRTKIQMLHLERHTNWRQEVELQSKHFNSTSGVLLTQRRNR
ncbi:unnamed protein product, partial [Ectocarpus sp. 8 AP-2014]